MLYPAPRRPRRGGFIKGCLALVGLGFLAMVALFVALMMIAAQVPRGRERPRDADGPRADRPVADVPVAAADIGMRPEVAAWFAEHDEFGAPASLQHEMPDWAKGPRQGVDTQTGRSLLFYIKNSEVLAVFTNGYGEREKVWGEYDTPDPPPPKVRRKGRRK
jgi:hypothetical protein